MATGTPKVKLNSNGDIVKSPVIIINAKKFYEGCICTSKEGDKYTILEYNREKTKIKFLDDEGYEYYAYTSAVRDHAVKNPFHPGIFGNYVGDGDFGRKKDAIAYLCWTHMFKRIYEANNKLNTNLDFYKHVSICKEWYNFQNFAQWYYDQLYRLNPKYLYTIDKDILQWNQLDKVYSPETCVMIPRELNSGLSTYKNMVSKHGLPIGVVRDARLYYVNIRSKDTTAKFEFNHHGYKTPEEAFEEYKRAKITYIREKADYYYKDNAITKQTRDALYNIDIVPFSESQIDIQDQARIAKMEIEKKNNLIEELNNISSEIEKFKQISDIKSDIEILQEKIRSSITKNK